MMLNMNSNLFDFSLVITNYNKARFIDRAIRSCLSQYLLRRSLEVIVVDDYSTDDSIEIIKEFNDDVTLIVNDTNQGVAYCSNIGLKHANGKYWMRVDADDYLSASACEFMGQVLDNNADIDYVYADHFRINTRGLKISKVTLDNIDALYMHGAGVLMRTDMLREIGGYDESLRNCEDYDLLYRLNLNGYIGYHIPIPFYRYYIHGGNITLSEDRITFKKFVENKHGI